MLTKTWHYLKQWIFTDDWKSVQYNPPVNSFKLCIQSGWWDWMRWSHHRAIQLFRKKTSEVVAAEKWSGRHVSIYKSVVSSMCVCQRDLKKTTLSKTNTFWARTQGLYQKTRGMGLIRSWFRSWRFLANVHSGWATVWTWLHISSFSKVGHMDGIINLSL